MKNSFLILFGVWLVILPLFGIPGVWRNNLCSVSGIFLILAVSGPAILKKLKVKKQAVVVSDSLIKNE